jgi:hypothetical protein
MAGGLADLTLKFKTQDIVEAIGDVNYGDTVTLITRVLIGERPIEGARYAGNWSSQAVEQWTNCNVQTAGKTKRRREHFHDPAIKEGGGVKGAKGGKRISD